VLGESDLILRDSNTGALQIYDINNNRLTGAIVLRALFIGALVAVTVRVSSPQSESLASVYETPGDLIRLALGFAVCLWIVIHMFMLPRTAEGYRTWIYLGLVVAPLAWAVAIIIW
jgi:hypothetical protein